MKARVKHNNEIIDVIQVATKTHLYDLNNVEFLNNPRDYWTRLEHQAAIAAMQGMMAHTNIDYDEIVDLCVEFAHALVEKLKEMEERK